ncbi:MAG: hypothetical protein FJ211_10145 [Ignavibacteria bacterium]|nr:hypothetical protein [Ignavibacteria bacterium]
MASTYSTNLKIELMGTGDQSGTWGDTTNTNLGTLLEEAIAGYTTQSLAGAGPTALTIPNGATGVGRYYVIEFTGSPTAAHNVTVPAVQKPYIIFNNTSASIVFKVSGQTGVTLAVGKKAIVYNNGTDVIEVVNAPVGEATTQTLTNKTLGATTITGDLLMSGTGQLDLPVGTTAQRSGSPNSGMIRFNSDNSAFEGYNGSAWGNIGGGATGSGGDQVFFQNGQTVTTSYSIPSNINAGSFGPITVSASATVTIPASSTWTVV